MRLKRQVGESAHGSQIDTDAMRGDFIKKHGYRILSHAERNASVQIGEICGRHYASMALRTGG